MILSEWHVTPEYVLDNWTDEQFHRFWQARNRRIVETARALQPKAEQLSSPESRRVSDTELFDLMGKTQLMPNEFKKWQN